MGTKRIDIYQECIDRGIPVRNHCSDLYIPVTPETTELVKKYNGFHSEFHNEVEGGMWYDVSFAYTPWWEAKAK